jgi:hypothetical protein
MKKGFGGIVQEFREGKVPRRPVWSKALGVLGLGLFILRLWREWSGL